MLIQILVILFLIIATGYLFLRLFSRLVNIDILSEMGYASRENKLLFFFFVFCYIMFFIFLFVSIYLLPMRTYQINEDHAGGFLGYNKGVNHMVFNPSSGRYEAYFWYDAPPPAQKFTEAFEVVSFFKLPSKKYYQSTHTLGWGSNLMGLIFAMLFFTGAYFCLYGIALEFNRQLCLQNKITHGFIATQFKSITGVSPLKALIIFLSIAVLILAWSAIKVNTIRNHYQDLYAASQRQIRSELLKRVSPGNIITGRVLSGYMIVESEQDTEYNEGSRRPAIRTSSRVAGYNYDVEFTNLIHIPVYLRVFSPRAIGNVVETSNDQKASPDYLKEYTFIVNPDYSVSFSM